MAVKEAMEKPSAIQDLNPLITTKLQERGLAYTPTVTAMSVAIEDDPVVSFETTTVQPTVPLMSTPTENTKAAIVGPIAAVAGAAVIGTLGCIAAKKMRPQAPVSQI